LISLIRRILCNRHEAALGNAQLFETEIDDSAIVNDLADKYWNELVEKNRIKGTQMVLIDGTTQRRWREHRLQNHTQTRLKAGRPARAKRASLSEVADC
jgi:hypothetical protein